MPRGYQDAILKDEKEKVLKGKFVEYFKSKRSDLSKEQLLELENELLTFMSELDEEFTNEYYNHQLLFKINYFGVSNLYYMGRGYPVLNEETNTIQIDITLVRPA